MIDPKLFAAKAKIKLSRAMGARLGWLAPVRAEGGWWIRIPDDHVLSNMRTASYERRELDFVRAALKPGETVLDIGANFGLYSILAAKQVGPKGRVLAFEPNPRNLLYLRLNLLLNRQRQVEVVPVALGNEEGEADFTCVSQGAYSTLHAAAVPGKTTVIRVKQTTLDAIAAQEKLHSVDFVKMDVEGAELLVLQGGEDFFATAPRPLVMCEFSDERAGPYGYTSRQVYQWLRARQYRWFRLSEQTRLVEQPDQPSYDYTNLVACPVERLATMACWIDS